MVYFGKKASGNLEALRQEIETLKQALNNCAKTNTENIFTEKQVINKTNTNDSHSLSIEYPNNKSGQIVFKEGGQVKAFIGKENPTQTQFIISNGDRQIQLKGGNKNLIINGSGLRAVMDVEFGTRIKVGSGSTTIKFTPEDNTTKTLQFFENQPTDAKRLMLKVSAPEDPNHVAHKFYVDEKIKFIEKTGISFTRQELEAGKITKYWANVNYSDLPVPNGKKIVSCNAKKPVDSQHMLVSFFPSNRDNQGLIEVYQYNSTTNITSNLRNTVFCFTYIN